MKLFKVAGVGLLVMSLSACGMMGVTSSTAVPTKANVASPVAPAAATNVNTASSSLDFFVASTTKQASHAKTKKGAKAKKVAAVAQPETTMQLNGATYYVTGPVITRANVKSAFVAKDDADQPAVAIRMTPQGTTALASATAKSNLGKTLLITSNGQVFSSLPIQRTIVDGVVFVRMQSLEAAKQVADSIRGQK